LPRAARDSTTTMKGDTIDIDAPPERVRPHVKRDGASVRLRIVRAAKSRPSAR